MKKLLYPGFVVMLMIVGSCSGLEDELAGTCVTCVTAATATEPELTITACANGDGTITRTENGVEIGVFENDTETFRIAQEATGANCN